MEKKMEVGKVCWFDIPVSDIEKAKAFYGELFGWTFVPHENDYTMIQVGEEMIGGLRPAQGPASPSDAPAVYITVDKLDDGIKRAKDLGAELIGERVPTGETGVFQLFHDADKNLMAMWSEV